MCCRKIGTVSLSDADLVFEVSEKSRELSDAMEAVSDQIVEECHERAPTLPCTVLRVLGDQRARLQKMSKEAMLQGTATNISLNRERMQATADLFEQSHYNLIHGNTDPMPRTKDYCMLQQMKGIHDVWMPFQAKLHEVYQGDTSGEHGGVERGAGVRAREALRRVSMRLQACVMEKEES